MINKLINYFSVSILLFDKNICTCYKFHLYKTIKNNLIFVLKEQKFNSMRGGIKVLHCKPIKIVSFA